MGWLKNRQTRQREMETVGAKMVARRAVSRPRLVATMRPTLSRPSVTATTSSAPQLAPRSLRPTGFYAPAQAPGGGMATGPQAEGQSAATALTEPGMDWSLYIQALSDREKDLLDTESENPWVTKRYLSAIERLKRDEFSANLLAEEQALWNESYVNQFGFDDAQQWAYDKAHGGTRWGPRSMGGGYDTFGGEYKWFVNFTDDESGRRFSGGFKTHAEAKKRVKELEDSWVKRVTLTKKPSRNARIISASQFGQDVVPHLCETQWGESDARCIQHLGDPTFGSSVGESMLRKETAELSQYFSQFGGVQFGGASRKDFFNKGYRTMKVVITARQKGHTVGHPMNPYHGGGWQEAAFDDGVEAAKAEFRALRLSK